MHRSYFEGFSIDAGRSESVFLEVDPFQVGDTIEGFCRDAADVVACRSEVSAFSRSTLRATSRFLTGSVFSISSCFCICSCYFFVSPHPF